MTYRPSRASEVGKHCLPSPDMMLKTCLQLSAMYLADERKGGRPVHRLDGTITCAQQADRFLAQAIGWASR